MEDFCGVEFWDTGLTWSNNSWPQFTDCFQDTVLQWVPCGYLWLIGPFYAYCLAKDQKHVQPFAYLFLAKLMISMMLVVLYFLEVFDEKFTSGSEKTIMTPLLWLATCIWHAGLVCLERSRNVVRSYFLWSFWMFGFVATVVPFYHTVALEVYDSDMYEFASVTLRCCFSIALVLLNCFAAYYDDKPKGQHPEISASTLTWLLFAWLEPLMFQGYKSPIQENDVFNLHPYDRCYDVYNRFKIRWQKELDKAYNRLLKKSAAYEVDVQETENDNTPLLRSALVDKPRPDIDNVAKPRVSFLKVLIKNMLFEGFCAQSPILIYVALDILLPFVLGWLISFTQSGEVTWHGFVYASLLIISKVVMSISFSPFIYLTNRLGIRLQSIWIASVFRKALTLSSDSRTESTVGEIVNLMSVDSNHIEAMANYSFWIWMCTIYFVAGLWLTIANIGISALAGFGFMAVMFLLNMIRLHKLSAYQSQIMEIRDERIKMMNEIFNGIKVIKLYGWEPMFTKMVIEIRKREQAILYKISLFEAFQSFAWTGALFWMNYLVFVTYALIDDSHHLDPNTTFVSLNYIMLIRLAVNMLPEMLREFVQSGTSVRRINKFLNKEDINKDSSKRDTTDSCAVRINNADFAWKQDGFLTLRQITLEVKPGQLVAVVGSVGSGKSSLLSALLGEMYKKNGHVNLSSSVAYVPQQAWIQNLSLKENILFGKPCDQRTYDRALDACALRPDIDILPSGDMTEIGEKGINLSGGQKQRVSLARAVYSNANIHLLDDPLSAVDSHVGKHIFNHVIGREGILKDKTRILVTHGIQWLSEVDIIYVMSDGEISECGTFEQLIGHNGAFAQFLSQYFIQNPEEIIEDLSNTSFNGGQGQDENVKRDILKRLVSVTSDTEFSDQEPQLLQRLISHELSHERAPSPTPSTSSLNQSKKSRCETQCSTTSDKPTPNDEKFTETSVNRPAADSEHRLTVDEEAAGGKVSWKVFWVLAREIGPKYLFVIGAMVLTYHFCYNYSNIWLANWTDDSDLNNFTLMPENSTAREDKNAYYIRGYTFFGAVQTISVFIYAILWNLLQVKACRKIHEDMLNSIMRAPMSFFDTTPKGRILNRFSLDINILDDNIYLDLESANDQFLLIVGIVITIGYTMPIFLTVIIPIAILVCFVQRFYTLSSCQLQRLSSKNKSPIFNFFSETLSGLSVIRAYQAQDRFIKESEGKVDNYQRFRTATGAANGWIRIRAELIACCLIVAACLFAVVFRDDLGSGTTGLIVTYAMNVTTQLALFCIQYSEIETQSVSVERIIEYSKVTSEAPWTQAVSGTEVSKEWPDKGNIEFMDYSTRYRAGLGLVLKGISCKIQGGEKVGIVGRTGAGKSSMVLSLFRLIEAAEGHIVIDGVDISTLGLHALRQHINILPQDPVLFAGSLRMNLDPFSEKTDSELWTALEHSSLKPFCEKLPDGLDHEVGEGGENLSMGQRQLVCLARTLIRKTKILVLDEATAAVDLETDDLIQKTIQKEFSECTILTIAHRLNTVLDYDRIMVLHNGGIVEFDAPNVLLANPSSLFFSMANDAGLVPSNCIG